MYEVSNLGRVRSVDRLITQVGHKRTYTRRMPGRILRQRKQNGGYRQVWLSKDGVSKPFCVHRLVALCFITKTNQEINHKDGNKDNNRVENLEWVSRSENIKHSYSVLLRLKATAIAVRCIETGESFPSMAEAGRLKNVNPISIGHCLAGRNKTAGGFRWERK